MCIPGDHGAPFVSPIRRSYPIRDSVPHTQTASVCFCSIRNCAPCSHHSPSEPRTAANRAFHIAIYLSTCYSTSRASSSPSSSLSSVCLSRAKSIHLLLTLLLLLCWGLTCVTSDSELPIMTNSSLHPHLGQPSDFEHANHEHDGGTKATNTRSTASDSLLSTGVESRHQKTTLSFSKHVLRRATRNRHTVRRRAAKGDAAAAAPGTSNVVAQLLNPALIQFICSRLPDPCARAAYLREHVRHELCLEIPFLYVLPNTTTTTTVGGRTHENVTLHAQPIDLYAPQSGHCRERMEHSLTYLSSDSLFEVFLSSPQTCSESLTEANRKIRDRLEPMFNEFDRLLNKSFCRRQSDPDWNVTGEFQCDECREAYRNWLCTTVIQPAFPLQIWPLEEKPRPGDLYGQHPTDLPISPSPSDRHDGQSLTESTGFRSNPESTWNNHAQSFSSIPPSASSIEGARGPKLRLKKYTSRRQYRLVNVEPCVSWCTTVETLCPYFNPSDLTANGGEPAFLCDEGHYHHSSRYQMIYRPNQQCETECCYSKIDMQSLSQPVAGTLDITDGAGTVQINTSKSRSNYANAPTEGGPSSSVLTTSSGLATDSTDDSLDWSEPDSSRATCESLQLRCTHHGYSEAVSKHLPQTSTTSPLVSDPHQPSTSPPESISRFQPTLDLSPNTIDQSSGLTSNRSLASVSCRTLLSHLAIWTCVLPVLFYIWPACFPVQLQLSSNSLQHYRDGSRCMARLEITGPDDMHRSSSDQTSRMHLTKNSALLIHT